MYEVMSDSKGKGRADAPKEAEPVSTPATSSSPNPLSTLINNVASSATALGRSAFAAPSSNELNSASSSALTGAGKAQSSSSASGNTSAWADSSKSSAPASSAGASQTTQPQGLRSHQADHATAAEAEFSSFLDSIPAMDTVPDLETQTPQPLQPTNQSLDEKEPWVRSYTRKRGDYPHPASIRLDEAGHVTVSDAQAHDGADVLAILDTFAPQELDYFEPQTIEAEVEEWRLTPEQISLAKNLAAELHVTPGEGHAANLLPRVFQDGSHEQWLPEEYAQDSHSHFGEVLPAEEARRTWIKQWESVLNRYQDDVWGGMLSLVQDAKEDIRQFEEGAEDRQPQALRRLGMVLGHIAKPQ